MDTKPKKNPAENHPEEIDSYLAPLTEDVRASLERIRVIVKEIVPQARESELWCAYL